MSLSETQEKLYKKGENGDLSKYKEVDFDPRQNIGDLPKTGFLKKDDVWEEGKDDLRAEKVTAFGIAGISLAVIVFISVCSAGFYYFRKTSFSEDRVIVSINGKTDSSSGNLIEYEIILNNDNRATLKNSSLKISYPESFTPEGNSNFKQEGKISGTINLDDVVGRETKKIAFKGRAYDPKGTILYIKAELFYNPAGFSGQFSASNQIGLNVISSPITLNFSGPQVVTNGDAIDYLIVYKNEGGSSFRDVKIGVDYPQGFTFSKSEPEVSEGNNIWSIGILEAGQEGRIVISGKMKGMNEEIKLTRVYVGENENNQLAIQNEESIKTKIGSSPLSIRQLVNEKEELNVNTGDEIRFKIFYKNEGTVGLRDVVVTEKIEGEAIDYEKITGLDFDMKSKTISWKSSEIPELKFLDPGKEGIIEFVVNVKESLPIIKEKNKNFIISSIAKIDSLDIPTPIQGNKTISGNKIDIKINSNLFLDVKGYYYDQWFASSGPLPPKVGKETTYTIKWKITNSSNNVSGARVESSLPAGVRMEGEIYPRDANIKYNERANSVVWEVGDVKAGTGITSANKEVSFQIKVIPTPGQVGTAIDIFGPSIISGKDLFTGNDLSLTVAKKTSNLDEDTKLGDKFTVEK